MSWNDQDIDHLFKGAKAPEPPAFQEEFWTEMEAMLPVAPKRRLAGFWWFSGLAATLVLLITGLFWLNESGSAARQSVVKTGQRPAPGQQPVNDTDAANSINGINPGEQETAQSSGKTDASSANSQSPLKREHDRTNESPEIAPVHPLHHYQEAAPLQVVDITPVPDPVVPEPAVERDLSVIDPLSPLPLSSGQGVLRTLADPKPFAGERFYVQASAGIGQSAQRNVAATSDLLHYYALGAGLYKRIDRMVLTFGVNGRVDFSRNVISSEMTGMAHHIDTRYSELYSVEMPVSLGFNFGRNTFSATVTPGFQTRFTGKESEFDNDVLVRSERTSGKVENSKTLTMEIGLSYWRTLQPNLYFGAAINADAIRPFNPNNFIGDQRMLPLNGQLILRRTF